MGRPWLLIARKDLNSLMEEKTLILAILVQLFIASFASFLVLGLTSFLDPEALGHYDVESANVALVGGDDLLRDLMRESRATFITYDSFPSAYKAFYAHRVDGIIVAPDAVDPGGDELVRLDLYLPKGDLKATLVTLQIKDVLERYEEQLREERGRSVGYEPLDVWMSREPETSSFYYEFIYGVLIPLLALTPAFISGGLVIDLLTEEVQRKTLGLLMAAPTTVLDVVHGKVLAATVIAPMQAGVWLVLLRANGLLIKQPLLVLVLATAVTLILVLMSAVLVARVRDRGTAQFLYSLLLILLFLSGYLYANSPLNLAMRLSTGSIDTAALAYLALYVLIPIPLYLLTRRMWMAQELEE